MTGTEHDIAPQMWAIRLHEAGGPEALVLERIPTPTPGAGEALVRVHAAAITPDELRWPTDRLPRHPPTSSLARWPPSGPRWTCSLSATRCGR